MTDAMLGTGPVETGLADAGPPPPRRRVLVPWGLEQVEAEVLGVDRVPVHGPPDRVQVHLLLPSDPSFPDPDGPVELVVHLSELCPGARAYVLTLAG